MWKRYGLIGAGRNVTIHERRGKDVPPTQKYTCIVSSLKIVRINAEFIV